MRRLHTIRALASSVLLVVAVTSAIASTGVRNIGPIGPIPLLMNDVVYVFFSPPLNTTLASCFFSSGGQYRLLTSMNESITDVPVDLGGTQGTYVQLIPQSQGHFDLILNVTSQTPFNMLLGIITKDRSSFAPYKIHTVSGAYFVEIFTMRGLDAGNWLISLSFSLRTIEAAVPWFDIPMPSSVGFLFLGAAIMCLAYPNAYLFTDFYYRSKKEEISIKGKIGVALFVIVSLLVIYWLYLRFI
jgi:hypothetical protein